jgi:hypothetical protein
MQYVRIAVSYERRLSDNNYGNRMASVHLEVDLDRGDDAMDIAALMLTQARNRTHVSLLTDHEPDLLDVAEVPA